jgi:hypothetical protein
MPILTKPTSNRVSRKERQVARLFEELMRSPAAQAHLREWRGSEPHEEPSTEPPTSAS